MNTVNIVSISGKSFAVPTEHTAEGLYEIFSRLIPLDTSYASPHFRLKDKKELNVSVQIVAADEIEGWVVEE